MCFKAIAILGSLGALVACADTDALMRPGAPAGMLNLINGSEDVLTTVAISHCSAARPSASRLETGEVIAPGAARRWAISQGCYDVQAGSLGQSGQSISNSRVQIGAERVHNLTVR